MSPVHGTYYKTHIAHLFCISSEPNCVHRVVWLSERAIKMDDQKLNDLEFASENVLIKLNPKY